MTWSLASIGAALCVLVAACGSAAQSPEPELESWQRHIFGEASQIPGYSPAPVEQIDYFLVSEDADDFLFSASRMGKPLPERTFLKDRLFVPSPEIPGQEQFSLEGPPSDSSVRIMRSGADVNAMLEVYRQDVEAAPDRFRRAFGLSVFLVPSGELYEDVRAAIGQDGRLSADTIDRAGRCLHVSSAIFDNGAQFHALVMQIDGRAIYLDDPAVNHCLSATLLRHQGLPGVEATDVATLFPAREDALGRKSCLLGVIADRALWQRLLNGDFAAVSAHEGSYAGCSPPLSPDTLRLSELSRRFADWPGDRPLDRHVFRERLN